MPTRIFAVTAGMPAGGINGYTTLMSSRRAVFAVSALVFHRPNHRLDEGGEVKSAPRRAAEVQIRPEGPAMLPSPRFAAQPGMEAHDSYNCRARTDFSLWRMTPEAQAKLVMRHFNEGFERRGIISATRSVTIEDGTVFDGRPLVKGQLVVGPPLLAQRREHHRAAR